MSVRTCTDGRKLCVAASRLISSSRQRNRYGFTWAGIIKLFVEHFPKRVIQPYKQLYAAVRVKSRLNINEASVTKPFLMAAAVNGAVHPLPELVSTRDHRRKASLSILFLQGKRQVYSTQRARSWASADAWLLTGEQL